MAPNDPLSLAAIKQQLVEFCEIARKNMDKPMSLGEGGHLAYAMLRIIQEVEELQKGDVFQ